MEMKLARRFALGAVAAGAMWGAERGSEEEAKAMPAKAAAHYSPVGREQALQRYVAWYDKYLKKQSSSTTTTASK